MNTVTALLKEAAEKLESVSESPLQEAEDIFCYVADISKTKLYTDSPTLSKTEQERFFKLIQKRASGIPLAYIMGVKGFYGRMFAVTPDTLIPRPETELLIEETITVSAQFDTPTILDVGTGSGCIAITLALEIPHVRVTATDIDAKALIVARTNAKRHMIDISFLQSDMLNDVDRHFDIIVANLPYVPEDDKKSPIKKSTIGLVHEPPHALYSGERGTEHYERFIEQIAQQKPAYLIIEIDPRQVRNLSQLMRKKLTPKNLIIKKDLAGHDRIIRVTLDN